SRKGSETRQTRADGVDRRWPGSARSCVTCALCEGTDETALTEAEADARGDEAVVWSPPHADAVCDQSSHADKRGGQGLFGVSPRQRRPRVPLQGAPEARGVGGGGTHTASLT